MPRNPRVLLVTGEYPPMRGGVGDYSALLRAALSQQGVDVRVLTSLKAAPFQPSAPVERGAWGVGRSSMTNPRSTPRAPYPTEADGGEGPLVPRWDFRCWHALDQAIAAVDPDVVHIQYQAGAFDLHPAIPLWPLRMKARRNRPKVIVTFHDLLVPYMFPKAGPLRRLAVSTMAAMADHVVVTNGDDAARLRWLGRRTSLIPIGSNIPVVAVDEQRRQAVRERFGVGYDDLLLGYFGFLTPSKGVDVLLRALSLLEAERARVRLLMVGGGGASGEGNSAASDRGYDRMIRELADTPSLRSKVLWTGFTEPEEVSVNLQALDLCVLPFREGASLRHGTLLAALVHGLPIVTTAGRGSAERTQLHADGTGTPAAALVPPDDPGALAGTIARLAGDDAERIRLANAARTLGEGFRWESIATRTIAVYREALG